MLEIVIDKQKCNLCGFCVDACPIPCLTFDDDETQVLVQDLNECLVCRNCEDHCPRRCLSVVFPAWEHRSKVDVGAPVTEVA